MVLAFPDEVVRCIASLHIVIVGMCCVGIILLVSFNLFGMWCQPSLVSKDPHFFYIEPH